MAAVQQNISYRRELLAGDIVEITSALLEIRDKSIRFVHEMRNIETGEIAARCETAAAHMDRGFAQINRVRARYPRDGRQTSCRRKAGDRLTRWAVGLGPRQATTRLLRSLNTAAMRLRARACGAVCRRRRRRRADRHASGAASVGAARALNMVFAAVIIAVAVYMLARNISYFST